MILRIANHLADRARSKEFQKLGRLVLIGAALSGLGPVMGGPIDRDWPEIIESLKPKEGQNFEQDLQLVKAFVFLERRIEAQSTLRLWLNSKYRDRAIQQLDQVSSLFFSQEVSNQYFEAVRLASVRNWGEAKEVLEPAYQKEPGNLQLLLRLMQVYWQMGLKSSFEEKVKQALEIHPEHPAVNAFAARWELDQDEPKAALKRLLNQKPWSQQFELPSLWTCEALAAVKRSSEVLPWARQVLSKNSDFWELKWWLVKNGFVSGSEAKRSKEQLIHAQKNTPQLMEGQEKRHRTSQYLWLSPMTPEKMIQEVEQEALLNEKRATPIGSPSDLKEPK